MKPLLRQEWILEHIKTNTIGTVNVLDSDFVAAYINATGAHRCIMAYGADKCPQLGKDLSALYNAGKLTRYITGIDGMGGMGFPRWVYSYSLKGSA